MGDDIYREGPLTAEEMEALTNGDDTVFQSAVVDNYTRLRLTAEAYPDSIDDHGAWALYIHTFLEVGRQDPAANYILAENMVISMTLPALFIEADPDIIMGALYLLNQILKDGHPLPAAELNQITTATCERVLVLIESYRESENTELLTELLKFLMLVAAMQPRGVLGAIAAGENLRTLLEETARMFNRDESVDRTTIVTFVKAILGNPSTANVFYTNDLRVMIDITIRELIDQGFDHELHLSYLQLLGAAIANTDLYREPSPRYSEADIHNVLNNIAASDHAPEEERLLAQNLLMEYRF